jgi:hypothetical protein
MTPASQVARRAKIATVAALGDYEIGSRLSVSIPGTPGSSAEAP